MKAIARPYTKEESDTLKEEFLKLFNQTHGAVYLTCQKMGIPVQTFHFWKLQDEDFKREIEFVRELTKDYLEINLVRDALKKGGADRMFYMKCQMKDRGYVEKERDTDEQRNGMKVVVEYKANEVDADLRARIIAEHEANKLKTIETDDTTNSN